MKVDLIDRIYECSLVPELWPEVLDELATLVDAEGGLLFAVREKVLSWTSSGTLNDVFQSYVSDGWFTRCTRRVCLFSQNKPSFLVEHDFWTDEQLDQNPIYRDFFRPRGLGWSAGTGLMMPTDDNIVFSVERAYGRGPIEADRVNALNELRPHLARAALVSARLGLRSAKGANETLAVLGLPALVMDESGAVIDANALLDDVSEHVQWRARNHVALSDISANKQLQSALEDPSGLRVNSFAMRGTDGRAAVVAHIVPIQRSAHDIFARSYLLLIFTPVTARRAPPVELLRSLFDLTPSEARVARSLATGDSIDDIASSGGVSRNTIRSQLRQVLEKIGCTRQAEATSLLSNIAIGPAATGMKN